MGQIVGGQLPGRNELVADIPGIPGYSVTAGGRVWSKPRRDRIGRTAGGRWLKQRTDAFGRKDVSISLCGRTRRHLVHRLALEAFVGPCPDGMEACHNNGDPADNRLENLRWDTRRANARDAVRHGTCALLGAAVPRPVGESHNRAKLTETDVRWIRYLRKVGIGPKDLSEVYRVSQTTVWHICSRITWRHI